MPGKCQAVQIPSNSSSGRSSRAANHADMVEKVLEGEGMGEKVVATMKPEMMVIEEGVAGGGAVEATQEVDLRVVMVLHRVMVA